MGQDNQNLAQLDQPIENQLTTISGDAVQCRKVIFDGEFCWFAVEKSQKQSKGLVLIPTKGFREAETNNNHQKIRQKITL